MTCVKYVQKHFWREHYEHLCALQVFSRVRPSHDLCARAQAHSLHGTLPCTYSDSSPLLSAPPGPSPFPPLFPSSPFSSAVPSSPPPLRKPTSSPSPDRPPSSRARRTTSSGVAGVFCARGQNRKSVPLCCGIRTFSPGLPHPMNSLM